MRLYLGVCLQGAWRSSNGLAPDLSGSALEVGGLTTITSRAGPTKAQMAPLPRANQQLWRNKSYLSIVVHGGTSTPQPQQWQGPSTEKEFFGSRYQL